MKYIAKRANDARRTMKCYQYQKSCGHPIFIKFDPNFFEASLTSFLGQMRFEEIPEEEMTKIANQENHARILELEEASTQVAMRIDETSESDRYGFEKVTPMSGYRVYRYKGIGMLVYSYKHTEWRLGCFNDFGHPDNELACRTIINRFLSWSLIPLGMVGFWGVPVDEGIVVMKQGAANGEAIFVNILGREVLSMDGIRALKSRFQIMKLDPTLQGRNIKMTPEEVLSFLSNHCTYFDYDSLSVPARQLIQTLSRTVVGLLHPLESFKPRTDLSLY